MTEGTKVFRIIQFDALHDDQSYLDAALTQAFNSKDFKQRLVDHRPKEHFPDKLSFSE
ncbi:hypothetical protein MK852_17750 [Shewanella benthica]|uniref:hypothetical protein n=1 Tax=Shewanella benthica TaxID=43661 RepID=UPI00187AB61B|nr:hypothetical protein [Shewanella benthica]MBE7213537.1 hypothetical protein [Shewanella benthica]MCL1063961.1 hypothetical protein [Shewanella benthica]